MLLLHDVLFFGKAMVPADILTRFEPWHTVLGDRPIQNHYLADVILAFHPMKVYIASVLSAGHFPLWLPHAGLGYPIIATQESFITFALPFYALLDFWNARSVELLGTFILAGTFAYAYLRDMGRSAEAALLGAIVAMLGFQFTQNLLNAQFVQSLLWLPLILLVLDRSRSAGSVRLRVLAGGITGIALLAGSLQGMLYLLFILGLDILWTALMSVRTAGARAAVRLFVIECVAVFGIGLLGSGLRLLPSLELLQNSERTLSIAFGAWAKATLRRIAATPMLLVGLISPSALGDHRTLDLTKILGNLGIRGTITGQEFKAYIGIIPLGCALFAMWARRTDWTVHRFTALLIVPVLLAMLTPLAFFIYFPRGLVMSVIPFAVLAAVGMDELLASDRERLTRFGYRWARVVVGALILGVVVTAAVRAKRSELTARARAVVDSRFNVPGADEAEREWQRAKANRFVESWSFPSAVIFGPILWGAAGLVALGLAARGHRGRAAAVAISATVVDLLIIGTGFLPAVDRATVFPPLESVAFLRAHQSEGRVLAMPHEHNGRLFYPPNALMHYGLDDAMMYESLYPSQGMARAPEMLDALGVAYVIVPRDSTFAGGTLAFDGEVRIYRRSAPLPRVWVAGVPFAAATDSVGMASLRDREVDLRRQVIIVPSGIWTDPALPPAADCSGSAAEIEKDQPERTRVRVASTCAGYVVLRDRYYPGWTARVNGVETHVQRADMGLMAVRVTKGTSEVDFIYRPGSVLWGLGMTLAGLLVTAVALFAPTGTPREPKELRS